MTKNVKKFIFLIVAIGLAAVLWYGLSPLFNQTSLDEPLPIPSPTATSSGLVELGRGPIVDTTVHPASGSVVILEQAGVQTLRYENLQTINGPDLFVYLSTDRNATDFIELGPLKATQGNINYAIPAGTDLSKYKYALVWCKQFDVLFNSADLGMSN